VQGAIYHTNIQDAGYYTILAARTCPNLCLLSLRLPSSFRSGDLSPNNLLPGASPGRPTVKTPTAGVHRGTDHCDHWETLKDLDNKIHLLGESTISVSRSSKQQSGPLFGCSIKISAEATIVVKSEFRTNKLLAERMTAPGDAQPSGTSATLARQRSNTIPEGKHAWRRDDESESKTEPSSRRARARATCGS